VGVRGEGKWSKRREREEEKWVRGKGKKRNG
jgi:hypothetical protein